jgi:hypothetical protein
MVFLSGIAAAQQKPAKNNMDLVGYNDLQARSAYQPTIHGQGNRWFAYIGHHGGVQPNPLTGRQESNGTSIVDVTDPNRLACGHGCAHGFSATWVADERVC